MNNDNAIDDEFPSIIPSFAAERYWLRGNANYLSILKEQ